MNWLSEDGGGPRWVPFTIDHLLIKHGLKDLKAVALLIFWVILIAVSMLSVFYMTPDSWVQDQLDRVAIYSFFLLYPPLIIGTLLVFWLGFEWGFIPVFLATFVIAFASAMPVYWAILFGVAFVLGLAVYALAYYCVPADISLRDIKSFAFFTIVSVIAAIASSLGSFIWSLIHDLSAAQTMIMWRGWWTGVFLQSMFIIAPLLLLLSPSVIKARNRLFEEPSSQKVSIKWIYGSILSIVIVLALFIFGTSYLGTNIMYDVVSAMPAGEGERILQANESYLVITGISIAMVLFMGLGGIYMVGSWNKQLKKDVEDKTIELLQSERELRKSLNERERLMVDIHDRMRNNLTIMLALLELQLKNADKKPMDVVLKESHSRLRSLSLIHETMYQTKSVDKLNLKIYAVKLFNRLHQSFKHKQVHIETVVNADEVMLEQDRGVPVAMIMNELLVNSYTHAFHNRSKGMIQVRIWESEPNYVMEIRDDGSGLPSDLEQLEKQHLGLKLVRTLTKQIHGMFEVTDMENSTFRLTIPIEKEILQRATI